MRKIIQLKNGDVIFLIEKLPGLLGAKEYFKVQRQDGAFYIVEEDELSDLKEEVATGEHLSTQQKLELFYNYFKGRPDVYATKWKSKSGKSGFSPHGEGEWVVKEGRSRKEIHTYFPYTLETINKHIRAEEYDFKLGVGIYPMLKNDKTNLIVIDFDNEGAIEEAKATIKVCREHEISVLIERSQSGEGIHLWFFFEEEILASTARYFVQLILRHAMAELEVMNFSSFDRIIPMQDKLPSEGFGNIIALPLRADKVKENKTVFLNDDFEVVGNLWEELASITKHSKTEIESYIETLKDKLPIQFYKQEDNDLDINLPANLPVELSGELIIDKHVISKQSMVQLAHLATFHNPEFYKRQNMRVPTWETPQFITSASEDENHLYLPRGIQTKLNKLDTKIEYNNNLIKGHSIDVKFKGILRDDQEKIVNQMLQKDIGIISAPTGFGKTVVAANIIAERKVSTLVIVNSKVLADQWKDRLDEFLDVQSEPFKEYTPTGRVRKKDNIGEFHSGKENLSRNVDIALFQTLTNREDLSEYLDHYGMVIVDEAHHVAAKTYEDVIKKIKAQYMYGLTATPERKDGLTPILFMRFGELIYEQDHNLNDEILTLKYFYPRFTNYSDYNPELNYVMHLNKMLENTERNEQIISDVMENVEENRPCLVLTERVAHIEILNKLLLEELKDISIYTLSSEQSKKENESSIYKMSVEKNAFVVIATSQYVGEGFDLPRLESIFFCLPFSWKGRTNQYVGRLHRGLEAKDELRIYDYIDIGVEMFARMYQKRMKEYTKMNYQMAEDDKTRANQTQLFETRNYVETLQFDLNQSNKIVIGVVSVRQLQSSQFTKLRETGKEIEVLIKEEKLEKHSELVEAIEKSGIKITKLAINPFSFIVCDEKIIWYGDIKFFMSNQQNSTTLRLLNHKIAINIIKQYI